MRTESSNFEPGSTPLGRRFLPLFVFALILLLSTQAFSGNRKSALSTPPHKEPASPRLPIKNFGKIGDHFFRGAQPRPEDYPSLAKLGVKTIIDLRDDPEAYAKDCATRAGLKYISLPLSDHDYPVEGSAEKFLSIVSEGENWPVFVHCAGGRHRTGVMTAVYRMTVEGWDIDKAYREMKDYDFYTRFGHEVMKDYIFDYSKKLLEKRQAQLGTTAQLATTASDTGVLSTPMWNCDHASPWSLSKGTVSGLGVTSNNDPMSSIASRVLLRPSAPEATEATEIGKPK